MVDELQYSTENAILTVGEEIQEKVACSQNGHGIAELGEELLL